MVDHYGPAARQVDCPVSGSEARGICLGHQVEEVSEEREWCLRQEEGITPRPYSQCRGRGAIEEEGD